MLRRRNAKQMASWRSHRWCSLLRTSGGENCCWAHDRKVGKLISLFTLKPEPVFHLETSDGGDLPSFLLFVRGFDHSFRMA